MTGQLAPTFRLSPFLMWTRDRNICSDCVQTWYALRPNFWSFKGHCGWMFIPVHVWSRRLLGDWKILSWPVHMLTQQRIQCKYLETSRSCAVKKLQKILIFLKSSVMFLSKNYFWKQGKIDWGCMDFGLLAWHASKQ